MAKKVKTAGKKTATRPARAKKTNIQTMIDSGSLTPEAAKGLNASARKKIEALTPSEVRAILKFRHEICKAHPQPAADGSIF